MRRVLVVDDSKAMRHYIAAGLDPWFDVEISHDGRDALDRLLDTPYDLVVTDLEMPRLDGMSLFSHLRSAGLSLPVVMVTDQDTERCLVQAAELGLGHIVPKLMLHSDFSSFVALLRSLAQDDLPAGLAPHLNPGGEVRTFIIGAVEEVPELLKQTDAILSHFPRAAIYKAVLGLLIQHGLSFSLPDGGLGPGGYLQVSVGADAEHVGLAVREPGGKTTVSEVLHWLSHPQSEGSRGWGLQVVRRFMDRTQFCVRRGVMSEVAALDLLDGYEGPRPLLVTGS